MDNVSRDIKMIASLIKRLRQEKGFPSSRSFAEHYKLDTKHYWRIESGCYNITLKTLINVLDHHDISFYQFSRLYTDNVDKSR